MSHQKILIRVILVMWALTLKSNVTFIRPVPSYCEPENSHDSMYEMQISYICISSLGRAAYRAATS